MDIMRANTSQFVLTGFAGIDKHTGGLQKGKLALLASAPAVGKTSFALNIVCQSCFKAGNPTLLVSLELPVKTIVARLLEMKICPESISGNAWKPYVQGVLSLTDKPFYITDKTGQRVSDIYAAADTANGVEKSKLDLIVIDYLQLLRGTDNFRRRAEEMAEIMDELSRLAQDLNAAVLVLAQIPRGQRIETRGKDVKFDLGDVPKDSLEKFDFIGILDRPIALADLCGADLPKDVLTHFWVTGRSRDWKRIAFNFDLSRLLFTEI